MNKELHIESWCSIKNGTVRLNGEVIFTDDSDDFKTFIRSAYSFLETDYSKFFKMDNLSKLAFLTADILLKRENLNTEEKDRKSTRLNSSHVRISYAVFCLKKKKKKNNATTQY